MNTGSFLVTNTLSFLKVLTTADLGIGVWELGIMSLQLSVNTKCSKMK